MSVKRESTVYRFVSERKTQVVIEQTRFLNTVFLYSEFNASPGLLRATAGHLPSLSVPEVGHLQILSCPGAEGQAFANPELLTRTRFPVSEYNYTEDFTGKTCRLAHLSKTGKN